MFQATEPNNADYPFKLFRDGKYAGMSYKTKKACVKYAEGMEKDWPEHKWEVRKNGKTVYPKPHRVIA